MFTEQELWTKCPSKKLTGSFFFSCVSHRVGFTSFNWKCLYLRFSPHGLLWSLAGKKKIVFLSLLGNIQTFYPRHVSPWVSPEGHLQQGAPWARCQEWPSCRCPKPKLSPFSAAGGFWRALSHFPGEHHKGLQGGWGVGQTWPQSPSSSFDSSFCCMVHSLCKVLPVPSLAWSSDEPFMVSQAPWK